MVFTPLSVTSCAALLSGAYMNSWQNLILLYLATVCVYFECALKFARLPLGKEVYKACY